MSKIKNFLILLNHKLGHMVIHWLECPICKKEEKEFDEHIKELELRRKSEWESGGWGDLH